MKRFIICLGLFSTSIVRNGQTVSRPSPQAVTPARLQEILARPLAQAIDQSQQYKTPLKAAYGRQIALEGKDCEMEAKHGQQPYNLCIGKAGQQADADFAIFYRNLQMLCDQDQLATLQASQRAWQQYKGSAMKAADAAWPSGTGAPGFAGEVYLRLVRDRMKELYEIYGLNISQQ